MQENALKMSAKFQQFCLGFIAFKQKDGRWNSTHNDIRVASQKWWCIRVYLRGKEQLASVVQSVVEDAGRQWLASLPVNAFRQASDVISGTINLDSHNGLLPDSSKTLTIIL